MANVMDVEFEFNGLQRMGRRFPVIRSMLNDFRPVFRDIAKNLESGFADIFDNEGYGWRPLAPSTVRERAALAARGEISVGAAHPILQRTGALKRSLADRGSAEHVEVIERHLMVYGSNVSYAGAHDRGGGRVPQRQILQPLISRAFEDAIPGAVRRELRRA